MLDRRERLGEACLDGPGQVVAELLELVQALLEILALRRQLLQALLLGVVLLFRERVHLPERLAAPFATHQALGQLVAVLALGGLRVRRSQPPPRLVCLGTHARQLDIDRADPFARLARAGAQLHLFGAQTPQLGAELGRASRLRLGTLPHRRLVALDADRKSALEPLGTREQLGEHRLARPPGRARIGLGQRARRRPRAVGRRLGGDTGLASASGDRLGFGAELAGLTGGFDDAAVGQPLGGHSPCLDLGHRTPQLTLTGSVGLQVVGEAARALGERSLEPRRRSGRNPQCLVEALCAGGKAFEQRRIAAPHVAQVRDRPERRLGGLRAHSRPPRRPARRQPQRRPALRPRPAARAAVPRARAARPRPPRPRTTTRRAPGPSRSPPG